MRLLHNYLFRKAFIRLCGLLMFSCSNQAPSSKVLSSKSPADQIFSSASPAPAPTNLPKLMPSLAAASNSVPAPTDLVVSPSVEKLSIAWTSAGGSTAGFYISIAEGSSVPACDDTAVNNGMALTYSYKVLKPGSNYSVSVCAFDLNGNVSAVISNTVTAPAQGASPPVTKTMPPAPTGLIIVADSQGGLTASWTSAGGTTTGFYIAYATGSKATLCSNGQKIGNVNSFQRNTGLDAGTTYSISICAYDANGNFSSTVSASGVTKSAVPSPTPIPTPSPTPSVKYDSHVPAFGLVSWTQVLTWNFPMNKTSALKSADKSAMMIGFQPNNLWVDPRIYDGIYVSISPSPVIDPTVYVARSRCLNNEAPIGLEYGFPDSINVSNKMLCSPMKAGYSYKNYQASLSLMTYSYGHTECRTPPATTYQCPQDQVMIQLNVSPLLGINPTCNKNIFSYVCAELVGP